MGNRFSVVVEVLKDFFDDRRIFDTGNDLNDTATLTTGFNVDIEHTFEALCPAHGGALLCRRTGFTFCSWFTTGFWCDLFA